LDNQSLLVRIVAAGLPLVVIAIVFGAIGYATKEPETTPIPPLAEAPAGPNAARGEVLSVEGGSLTLTAEDGTRLDYTLAPDATVEVLEPISLAGVEVGDWINGGAIPHPQTLLALERLILLPEPVTP
jgi:hypothetical protein